MRERRERRNHIVNVALNWYRGASSWCRKKNDRDERRLLVFILDSLEICLKWRNSLGAEQTIILIDLWLFGKSLNHFGDRLNSEQSQGDGMVNFNKIFWTELLKLSIHHVKNEAAVHALHEIDRLSRSHHKPRFLLTLLNLEVIWDYLVWSLCSFRFKLSALYVHFLSQSSLTTREQGNLEDRFYARLETVVTSPFHFLLESSTKSVQV